MTTETGYVEFKYHLNHPPYKYSDDLVNKQNITIRADSTDLNVFQYYSLFKSFLRSISFDEYNIMRGAANVVFNEEVDDKTLVKLSKEFDFNVDDVEPCYLSEEQKKEIFSYFEKGDFKSKSFTSKELEILDIAFQHIAEQKDKIREQEGIIEEWVIRYDEQWGKK